MAAALAQATAAFLAIAAILAALAIVVLAAPAVAGQLEIRAVDGETGEPLAVRMHLRNPRGKPVRPPRVPAWHDHFCFDGRILLDLPNGDYEFDVERGPEYKIVSGHFSIATGANDSKTVELRRFVNLKKEGWYSGDLHIGRPLNDVPLLMLADDLHFASIVTTASSAKPTNAASTAAISTTTTNNRPPAIAKTPAAGNSAAGNSAAGNQAAGNPADWEPKSFAPARFLSGGACYDDRGGGGLLLFQTRTPPPLATAMWEYPSAVDFLKMAKRAPSAPATTESSVESLAQGNAVLQPHADAARPFSWDLPVWIASRRLDSVAIAHSHLQRDAMVTHEAGGYPRDSAFYPNPHGIARWSLDIYSKLLDCGLRLPPSAGSGSGWAPNPVGYNRVYVHCDGEPTWEAWWEGLRAGRSFVTNGPLLRPQVNGELPGYSFQAYPGEKVELSIALQLSMRERVEYLEIIKDGKIIQETRLADWVKNQGELPTVEFDKSGWLAIRAITNNPRTFRFAMSAPYYVMIGDQPRVSRSAAQFFIDWIAARERQLSIADAKQREEVLRFHRAASDFFEKIRDRANVD
ncbi:MAG: CehA/McbA family metallohydrolase [Planctomycetota bacterium]